MTKPRNHADDLRGASRLAIEATKEITSVVEAMHARIASGPSVLGRPLSGPARAITGVVYGTIRGVTGLVGSGLDVALQKLGPALGESEAGPERSALVAALNGVLGDYLAETKNPLAIEMSLRRDGQAIDVESGAFSELVTAAKGRVLLLVHGSSMHDGQWSRNGHDHGAILARDHGWLALYLRYNSGLHVSTNGAELSGLIETFVAQSSIPVEELVLIGHSMGGLVIRSACNVAESNGHRWRTILRKAIFLGSPHHGAVLERSGNLFEKLLGVSSYSAPIARLAKVRSAGVTDLRYGYVDDVHWRDRDRFELGLDPRRELRLPEGVACFAVAGSLSPTSTPKPRGDGLVSVDSALGRHRDPPLDLGFSVDNQYVSFATGHLDLLDRRAVFDRISTWLGSSRSTG